MKRLLSMLAGLLLTANSYAMHVSLTLSDDIIANKDRVSYAYDVNYKNGGADVEVRNMHMTVEGIYLEKTKEAINALSSMLADITPIDGSTGQHSTLSFGYVKADGTKVWPSSCQNIPAKMEMNLVMNETGCGELS